MKRRIIVVAALSAVLLALGAVPANASQTRVFEELFGSAAQPAFVKDKGIAFDQDTKQLLVLDSGPQALFRFNADGTASEFPAEGDNSITEGTEGAFEIGSGREAQVAIDESGGVTDGNIYLAQGSKPVLEIFDSEGEPLGHLDAAGIAPFGGGICGVAVDGAGNIFLGDKSGAIHRFEPTVNPPVDTDHSASFEGIASPCAMAAGTGPTAGFLFVTDLASFGLFKVNAASGAVQYEFPEIGHRTVAIDPATGRVLSGRGIRVREFDASAATEPDLITEWEPFAFNPPAASIEGLASNAASEQVYLSRNRSGAEPVPGAEIFSPFVAVPEAETGEATEIEETTAVLNGTVNPDGEQVGACFFEYGLTTAYGETVPCDQSPAEIGAGEAPVPVSADIEGLDAGAEYHFRLVAANTDIPGVVGVSRGADASFKLISRPVIGGQWAEDVGTDSASLGASIDPEGFATTYFFEWGTDETYGQSSAAMELPADSDPHTVGALPSDLESGTTYHYRVVAESAVGKREGEDRAFTTFAVPTAPAACANDALRSGPGAKLPDCRGYELVSPLDKNGGDAEALPRLFTTVGRFTSYKQASTDGDRLTYSAGTAFADAVAGPYSSQYLASRGSGGWSTHGISQPRGTAVFEGDEDVFGGPVLPLAGWDAATLFEAFSDDLCSAWVRDTNTEPLTPDALTGYVNLYRRGNCGSEDYESLSRDTVGGPGAPAPFEPASIYLNDSGSLTPGEAGSGPGLRFQGASADLSHQVFVSGAALSEDAPAGKTSQLYDLHEGGLHLISVLPNGTPDPDSSVAGVMGTTGENRESNLEHALAGDGSAVFWTSTSGSSAGAGEIFARLNPGEPETEADDGEGDCVPHPTLACTIEVSAEGEELSSSSTTFFRAATPDGSAAMFTVGSVGNSDADLYLFDVASRETELVAGEVRGVVGASEDLSRIYFASEEDLDEAGEGEAGELNLYLRDGEDARFIATIEAADFVGGTVPNLLSLFPIYRASRVSPDGSHLAFQTLSDLDPQYSNTDPETGKRFSEVYRYDAEADELECVSCNPTGARASGGLVLEPYEVSRSFSVYGGPEGEVRDKEYGAAATLPTWEREQYASRVLSEDGDRLFFHSNEALVLGDSNGAQDLYQWEAPGTGSCEEGGGGWVEQNGGCISLISTGTSPQHSEFIDASADGEDVFFSTTAGIHPKDEGLIDIYDARVGGGFAPPEEAPECVGDACQSVPAPPEAPIAPSAGYRGAGNLPAPARNCRRAARRAAALARGAKRARRASARASVARRKTRLRRRSTRLARKARSLSRNAKRCRRANRANRNRGGSR